MPEIRAHRAPGQFGSVSSRASRYGAQWGRRFRALDVESLAAFARTILKLKIIVNSVRTADLDVRSKSDALSLLWVFERAVRDSIHGTPIALEPHHDEQQLGDAALPGGPRPRLQHPLDRNRAGRRGWWWKTQIALDLDWAKALDGDANGGGGAIRLGYELDLVVLTLIPEIGGSYHSFSDADTKLYRGFVGGRLRFAKVLEPGIYAHLGIGRADVDRLAPPVLDRRDERLRPLARLHVAACLRVRRARRLRRAIRHRRGRFVRLVERRPARSARLLKKPATLESRMNAWRALLLIPLGCQQGHQATRTQPDRHHGRSEAVRRAHRPGPGLEPQRRRRRLLPKRASSRRGPRLHPLG